MGKTRKNRNGGASRCDIIEEWYKLCYDDIADKYYIHFFNFRDERWYYNEDTNEFVNNIDNTVCHIYKETAIIYNITGLTEPELIFKFLYNKQNGDKKLYVNKNGFVIKNGKVKLKNKYNLYEYDDNWQEYYDTSADAYYWYNKSEKRATFLNPYEDLNNSPANSVKSSKRSIYNSSVKNNNNSKSSKRKTNSKEKNKN